MEYIYRWHANHLHRNKHEIAFDVHLHQLIDAALQPHLGTTFPNLHNLSSIGGAGISMKWVISAVMRSPNSSIQHSWLNDQRPFFQYPP
jgi:hypothetical protein